MSAKKVPLRMPVRDRAAVEDRWVEGESMEAAVKAVQEKKSRPTKAKQPEREEPEAKFPGKVGRPRRISEKWAKTSIVLMEREILELDRMALVVREKAGKIVTRSDLIRAILDRALEESGTCEEITEKILAARP